MPPRRQAARPNLIDLLTPDVVMTWIPDALLDDARRDAEQGRVARPAIHETYVESIVADDERGPVRVRIEWTYKGPVNRCACDKRRLEPCSHGAALALFLIGDAYKPHADKTLPSRPSQTPLSLAEHEIHVRRERGASELFEVTPLAEAAAAIFGRYEVRSPSSRTYEVTLRALDAPHNSCSCPDLATNLLGTCKHIEAVLFKTRKRVPTRLRKALRKGLPESYLHLVHLAERFEPAIHLRLRANPSPAERTFWARRCSADGRLLHQENLAASFPALALDAARAGIEISPEVARFAERARDLAEQQRTRRVVTAEVMSAGPEQPGLRGALYPYQVEGTAFLASRKRALLADEMGLGKTAQAIAALLRLMRTDDVRRALIVCPASLKRQWAREIERFTGLGPGRVAVVAGPREARQKLYGDPPDILITSYELARADENDIAAVAPDLLILDEAQRIKNWRTQTADAIKRVPSRYAFVLTGTPLENRLDDLYSLMQVIDPHLFGPLWRFNHDFTERDDRGKVTGYKNLDELRRRIEGVMLRRRKDQVMAQLPAQIINRLSVPMSTEQAAIHDDAEQQVGILVAKLQKRPLTPAEERRLLQAFQRMRLACDAAGLVDKDVTDIQRAPKLEELAGLLEEICVHGGHKVVVFSEWERMQAMAAEICEELNVGHVRLHGGVPTEARDGLIKRFFDDPLCKVFLATDAGGVGLNLQAASHVVNLDLPWNPAVLAQRVARVHRIGQARPVNVVLMVSEASFEERLLTGLDAKRALFAAAVGDDNETTELSRMTMAARIETLMSGSFAASTGKPAREEPQDEVARIRGRLGDALERIVRLPNGRLLGVVRGDVAPPVDVPALLLPANTVEALLPLGDASPFAKAELLYRAEPVAPPDPVLAGRRARLAVAERKLAAARALIGAAQGVEALRLLRDALTLGCRAASASRDPGEDAAAVLCAVYGELIPDGSLSVADAHALVRAGELARAFDGAAISPPDALLADVAREAIDLLARVRERLASIEVTRAADGTSSSPSSSPSPSPSPEEEPAARARIASKATR